MNRFCDTNYSFKQLSPIYAFRSKQVVSLEKGLKPNQSQIDQLSYDIKTSKRHCHFLSEHHFTKDQLAVIYIYTMEWDDTTLNRLGNYARLIWHVFH